MNAFLAVLLLFVSVSSEAVESEVSLAEPDVDIYDKASVRRGAGYFVNYCMGCHSLKLLRYSQIGRDLNWKEEDMRKHLIPSGDSIQENILTSMNANDGANWFGVAPPDLSLVARSRGEDWLYTYLKGFYVDPTRPTGVNNIVFDGVGMPNVFWQLQGAQKPVFKRVGGHDVIVRLEPEGRPGSMPASQFDQTMTDLVNFLVYAAEPARYQRVSLGKYVMLVLVGLMVVFYKLKKEYWKDVN